MSKIIIKKINEQHQVFEITKYPVVIGRGEDCDLVLPNISVSREHARIEIREREYYLTDIGSENGINVNGKLHRSTTLNSKDNIIIGNYHLVYLGEKQEDNFYRGRAVKYFPNYQPSHAQPTQDATHKLSIKEYKKMLKEKEVLSFGSVVDTYGRKLFPEANPLTFGSRSAMVLVQGFLIYGIVASIDWNGKSHEIHKHRWWVPLKINGVAKKDAVLNHNDHLQIGSTNFRYMVLSPNKKS